MLVPSRYCLDLTLQTILLGLLVVGPAYAQSISADTTLPIPTRVIPLSNVDFAITNGTAVGGNLFHSFSQFSVPTGGSVLFVRPMTIQNIITRVTGGVPSSIDGFIRANGQANLFIINPSGILFGPNAQLNIGGSFLASTANSLKFADGSEFSATAPLSPLLTVGVPVGLQYNGPPAGITVQGATLEVPSGQTLALVGGNLTVSGATLAAPQGQIEIGGLAEAGTVGLGVSQNQLQLNFPAQFGRSELVFTAGTLVSTSSEGGGNINLTGRQITIEDSRVETDSFGAEPGGNLTVSATDSVLLTGTPGAGTFSNGLFAETLGDGNAGSITINTTRLMIQGEARVSAATFGAGQGGDLTVNAAESVELVGVDPPVDEDGFVNFQLFTGLLTDTEGAGKAGNLVVNTTQLVVRDGAQISAATFGTGDGGNLTVNASESVELLGVSPSDLLSSGLFVAVQPTSTGNAGNLTVNTRRLIVQDGAQIFAGTGGVGNGGELLINASESIEVAGTSPTGFNSALLSTTDDLLVADLGLTTGKAGNMTVNTQRLVVRDGGQVSTSTFGNTQGGGNLVINASESILVSGAGPENALGGRTGILAGTPIDVPGTGDSGNVTINTGQLVVQDQARVAVNNQGTGNAGILEINARSILLENQGELVASTASGEGGNIQLQVQDIVLLRGNSLISAEAGGTGNGGNISIQSSFLVALDNSDVVANAIQGRGGNIQISATSILGTQFRPQLTAESDITASSEFGVSGVVEIRTPEVDPTRGLVVLPVELVDATRLIVQGCGTAGDNTAGRFVVTGRGGLPPTPESLLNSDTGLQDIQAVPVPFANASPAVTRSVPPVPAAIVEAQRLVQNAQGEVILMAQSPPTTPYSFWLSATSCHAE